jgi:hypothetical protein
MSKALKSLELALTQMALNQPNCKKQWRSLRLIAILHLSRGKWSMRCRELFLTTVKTVKERLISFKDWCLNLITFGSILSIKAALKDRPLAIWLLMELVLNLSNLVDTWLRTCRSLPRSTMYLIKKLWW